MVNRWPFLDQLTGEACPLCRMPGGLCEPCREALPRNRHPCALCALPLPDAAPPGSLCADCQDRPPAFDRAVAPLLYRPPVDRLLADFKYHRRLHLGRLLAEMLAPALLALPHRPGLLVPVPSPAGRLAERGFNPAAELTRRLSRRLAIPWSSGLLLRNRDRGHQLGAGRRRRQRNVRGAFGCRADPPPHVAVIDDVITTGATVDEAGRVLRAAGARQVDVWAVARTPRAAGR